MKYIVTFHSYWNVQKTFIDLYSANKTAMFAMLYGGIVSIERIEFK